MRYSEALTRFADARVARLATADGAGVPHLVPVTFAVSGGEIVFAVDHKPKRSTDLHRLRNIATNPTVCFLVDAYDEDWTALWWIRADGQATIHTERAERSTAIDWLCAKYAQYRERPPEGPVVRTRVTVWRHWSAT
ncbi:MAG TPA: TIGR03668 family PPOX class F420-dependent oxidoreductase [Amycolatopsis sp.]|nr:TIGR03668 family PPOX class F420-dependent oxidoreductase [Amycolatopsis sp.]